MRHWRRAAERYVGQRNGYDELAVTVSTIDHDGHSDGWVVGRPRIQFKPGQKEQAPGSPRPVFDRGIPITRPRVSAKFLLRLNKKLEMPVFMG